MSTDIEQARDVAAKWKWPLEDTNGPNSEIIDADGRMIACGGEMEVPDDQEPILLEMVNTFAAGFLALDARCAELEAELEAVLAINARQDCSAVKRTEGGYTVDHEVEVWARDCDGVPVDRDWDWVPVTAPTATKLRAMLEGKG